MSNFLDGYHRSFNPVKENDSWANAMQVKYPLLVDAMVGSEGSGASGPTRPPLSFILSAKDGHLRFSLSSKESSRSYSGPINDPTDPLMSAETCLQAGSGQWWTKHEGGTRR